MDQTDVALRATLSGLRRRPAYPGRLRARYIFNADPMAIKEPPDRASANPQTAPPRAERYSSSDVSRASDRRAKSQSAGASMTAERRSPPTPWGETVPLFRQRLTQETTGLGLTPKTPAAEQRDRPPSTDKTTRSRKSIEYICSSQDHQRKSIIKSGLMIRFDRKML